MTDFCHIQTPVWDLQFHLIGSVFERRNMAAVEQTDTHLPKDSKEPSISEQSTPEQILSLGLAFWGSKTLLSAVEIGLFTELAKGSLDFETLA